MNLVAFPVRDRDAAGIMAHFDVGACTDVTGFGLLGHLAEMVSGSGMSARIYSGQVPLMAEALEFAAMGLIPAGAYRNREFREPMIIFADTVARARQDVLFDPQTSGGLLISVSARQADALAAALEDALIGERKWNQDDIPETIACHIHHPRGCSRYSGKQLVRVQPLLGSVAGLRFCNVQNY